MDDLLLDTEERMEKAVNVLKDRFRGMRTGRANPGLVENIRVEYYGSPTPLKQIASISAPEVNLLVIRPFDPSSIADIDKAIQASDLGINPNNDGKLIRLVIPPLSEERRRDLVTGAKKAAEEAKVSLRNIRRDANKKAEQLEKDKKISEDDRDNAKEEIQKLINDYSKQAENLVKKKSEELMEI
ncbi:MAG: ribosome recycling factor [Planctomycetota bacterium]